MTPETEVSQVVIDAKPEELMVVRNIRFGLIPSRLDYLIEQIKTLGYVHTNLKVFPLETPGPKGQVYGIREGHYRHAAVLKLNAGRKGMGLTLPCQVEEAVDELTRISLQLSENMDRNELSPMDKATVIQQFLDAGLQKVEIRQKFLSPGKGKEMKPLSNAMLNIYLDFLKFPAEIQSMIHTGELGVKEAYKLTTKSPELWEPIITQAKADREAEANSEEKLEEKFLEAQKKAADQEAKEIKEKEALEAAQKLAQQAQADADAKLSAAAEAYTASQKVPSKNKDEKAKAVESFKAKEVDAKAAEKAAADAKTAAEKLAQKAEAKNKEAAERREKLEAARKEALGKMAKGKLNVEKAAKKVETNGGPVPLNAVEMRKVIADLSLPGSFPKVAQIAQAIARCFAGVTTDAQCTSELGYLTGERKERPKTLPKEAAAKA